MSVKGVFDITMKSTSQLLLLLGLCLCSPAESKGIQGARKGATLEMTQSTGGVRVWLKNDKSVFELTKAPTVRLGGTMPADDPDMFRAVANGSLDVIVVLLRDEPMTGRRVFDQDGYASLGDRRYTLKQAGDIESDGDVLTVTVDLEKVKSRGTKKDGSGDDDGIRLTEEIMQRDRQRRAEARKRTQMLRPKRAVGALSLELAIFVDKGFYDKYVTRHASLAKTKIDSFIQAAVDVMNSNFKTLERPITVVVKKYQVWQTRQPEFSTQGKTGGSIQTYMGDLPSSPFNPMYLDVDHTMLFSGYGLESTSFKGLAYKSTLCRRARYAVSVMNYMGFATGEIATHELGHSFGLSHDGRPCSPYGFLMAAQHIGGGGWSTCSRQVIARNLAAWDATGNNCLTDATTINASSTIHMCTDILANICRYVATDTDRFCKHRVFTIPASKCLPAESFPKAAADGLCFVTDACQKTCLYCSSGR